jgi:hypothetical protein
MGLRGNFTGSGLHTPISSWKSPGCLQYTPAAIGEVIRQLRPKQSVGDAVELPVDVAAGMPDDVVLIGVATMEDAAVPHATQSKQALSLQTVPQESAEFPGEKLACARVWVIRPHPCTAEKDDARQFEV